MIAELIFSGTELLLGQIVNTNARDLSVQLAAQGIDVYHQVTVGDNQARLANVIRAAMARADLIIIGGGLGPTEDDVSREALAEALGLELKEDPMAMANVSRFFDQRGIPMPENNRKQGMVPPGGRMLPNPIGTAPGLLMEQGGKTFVLLPGPPRELLLMVEEQLLPYLAEALGERRMIIRSRILKICGIGESSLEIKIQDLLNSNNPTLATTVKSFGETHLRITAKTPDKAEADAMISETEARVRERVEKYIFGTDSQTLEGVVGGLLADKKMTLAVAESCTGGLLAHRLTNIPGSSTYFQLGVSAYDNRCKQSVLAVDQALLAEHGAVSPQVAVAMAQGVRRLAGTDVGIGITGIAGPGGGTPDKPVGLVYIALDGRGEALTRRELITGSRLTVKERSAQSALFLIWRYLSGEAL